MYLSHKFKQAVGTFLTGISACGIIFFAAYSDDKIIERKPLMKSFAFENSNKKSWKTAKLEYWDNNQDGKLDEIRLSFYYDSKEQITKSISSYDSDDNSSLETLVLKKEFNDKTTIILTGIDNDFDEVFEKIQNYSISSDAKTKNEIINPDYHLSKAKAQLGSFVLRVQGNFLNE